MYDAADVRTHGIDGSVGAETCGVDPQVGGALVDHIPDDVDLHLRKQGDEQESVEDSLDLDLKVPKSSPKAVRAFG